MFGVFPGRSRKIVSTKFPAAIFVDVSGAIAELGCSLHPVKAMARPRRRAHFCFMRLDAFVGGMGSDIRLAKLRMMTIGYLGLAEAA